MITSNPESSKRLEDQYVYQYDAFNRLIRVNLRGNVVIADGTLCTELFRYTRDAISRPIRK